jgi:hypothetical protein
MAQRVSPMAIGSDTDRRRSTDAPAVLIECTTRGTLRARRAPAASARAGARLSAEATDAVRRRTIVVGRASRVQRTRPALAAAVDVGFGPVLRSVGAGGGATRTLCARAVGTVRAEPASHAVLTRVARGTAAVDVRLRGILNAVGARRRRAHAVHARGAQAIRAESTRLAADTTGAGAAAIRVGLAAVLDAVRASRLRLHAGRAVRNEPRVAIESAIVAATRRLAVGDLPARRARRIAAAGRGRRIRAKAAAFLLRWGTGRSRRPDCATGTVPVHAGRSTA